MSNCADCTNLVSFDQPTSSCKKTRSKVTEVRVGCEDNLVETYAAATTAGCTIGYIDSLVSVDPVGTPTPLINIPIFNETEFDETNAFSFDRDADVGEDTWSINPGVKVFNDDHQCVLDSMKGQDVVVFYKVEGRDGGFVWRRLKGKLTAVEGGLIAGYTLTVDTVDPAEEDKPLWVSLGAAPATTTAIDALTAF